MNTTISPTKRDFLSLQDLTTQELFELVRLATDLKRNRREGRPEPQVPGTVLALLFEKPSLRTRVSFEVAIAHLGGSSTYLGSDVGWGQRETVADFARTLSRYVDGVVYRGASQQELKQLAAYSTCPVINGLTREAHPCQALADLVTIQERWNRIVGPPSGLRGGWQQRRREFRHGLRPFWNHVAHGVSGPVPAPVRTDPPTAGAVSRLAV